MYQRHNDLLISDELIAGLRDSEHACGILKFSSRWFCKSNPCEASFHARGLPQPPQRARLSARLSLQESCVGGPELMTTWKVCYWVGCGGLNPRRLMTVLWPWASSLAPFTYPTYVFPARHRCCVVRVGNFYCQLQIGRSERNQADDYVQAHSMRAHSSVRAHP